MNFAFKLSRRLAAAWFIPLAAVTLAACDTREPFGSGEADPQAHSLSPGRVTAEIHQPIKLGFREAGGSWKSSFDVTWSIDGPGGSISGDGTFVATQPGVYQIRGTRGNGKGNRGRGRGNGGARTDTSIVVVVPTPPAVVAIDVTPSTAAVDAGERLQFEAAGRDANGSRVALGVEWSATGGSIDAGGLYIAGADAGPHRVIARHASSGLADTAEISVHAQDEPAPAPAPSAPTGGGNQPADFIMLSDRGFGAKAEHGWTERGDANFTIASDVSAPRSSQQVGQARFPKGHPAGSGPIHTSLKLSGQKELYLSFWVKLSENWYGSTSGVNKIFFIWTHGKPAVYLSAQGVATGGLEPQLRVQDSPDGARNLRPNLGGAALQRGRWHRWEVVLKANTPGRADGVARWWLDGQKIGDYSDLKFSGVDQSSVWEYVVWNPTYGGSGDPVPHDQWMWMDHTSVAGL
jgi:hypothetical protein